MSTSLVSPSFSFSSFAIAYSLVPPPFTPLHRNSPPSSLPFSPPFSFIVAPPFLDTILPLPDHHPSPFPSQTTAPAPFSLFPSLFSPFIAGPAPPCRSSPIPDRSLPVVPQLVTGTLPTMLPVATHQIGSIALMPAQAVTQQATRHARRVYVGGLPPMANEQTIATFFSHVMSAIGGNAAGPGSNIFQGVPVKVRRPTDYNPSLAATLGPSQPSPHLNLGAVGLLPSTIGGSEGPDRVFVGGLPYYFTDAQIRELLESFGPLRGFDLVKDRDTGNSKGYGFCVYQDPSVTDIACAALNGLKMGEKTLTVRRATASMGQMKPEQELILQQAHEHIAIQKLALQSGGASHFPGFALGANTSAEPPTKVVCLTEVVSVDELRDDEVYKEILEDMREESEKFGSLINLVIPRPGPTGEAISGVGKVFLEYENVADSARAKIALHGRRFGGNVVSATYYSEEKFSTGDYDAIVVA
ncbi:hypothetical protein C4D60_Mb01t12330 [Musa balbisiana]|uniref:Splicing factor U2af large subunit n=1 Tax=Musa balbisiana TaxID=52838 RepID=A0A4S8JMJ8_MUSBA|nr:hypothetical protein C4D60_Mb01t12330 [Musa balbisiana]